MKIYTVKNWKKVSGTFPIVIEYDPGLFLTEETRNVIFNSFENLENIADLHIENIFLNHTQLNSRLNELKLTSGTRYPSCLSKNHITSEKLYKLIHWEDCKKNEERFIQKRLRTSTIFQRIFRSA